MFTKTYMYIECEPFVSWDGEILMLEYVRSWMKTDQPTSKEIYAYKLKGVFELQ